MHIHLPKAIHGWREFAKEIAIIVIGVLIALGFEQVVEWVHWQHKVAEGEERLRVEGAQMFKAAAESAYSGPCVIGQLQQMEQRVLTSGDRLSPTPLQRPARNVAFAVPDGVVLKGNFRLVAPSVWDALREDGTAMHMPVWRQRRLSVAYNIHAIRNAATARIATPSQALGQPIPLDPATRAGLIANISEVRNDVIGSIGGSVSLMGALRDVDLAPPPAEVDDYLATRSADLVSFCRTLGLPMGDWRAQLARMPSLKDRGLD